MIRTEAEGRAHKSFAVGGGPRVRPHLIATRRAYKSWVADDTIEDYALRFTPPAARRFGLFAIADTAFGATSFMALEVIGALLTLADGTRVAVAAIVAVSCLLFVLGLPITLAAARRGIDIDLLTRGAGFGYLGSTATSLVYATFTFLFFAFEASILAEALRQTLGLPLVLGEILAAAVVIPMVMRGIAFISRFQRLTQPVWLVLTVLPVVAFLGDGGHHVHVWITHPGRAPHASFGLAFGSAASVVVALVPQIGEQVDYLRFLPERTRRNRVGWWCALLVGGPGWVIPGVVKMLIGSALATLAAEQGSPSPAHPETMYGGAFALLVPGHAGLASALALALIVVAQLKINVTNAYSGSIAWSNVFARLTRNYPGRAVAVLFNVGVALALMLLGVYPAIAGVLVCFSVVACGWLGALFADLAIARPLGLAPRTFDHKRAHLHDINPVGVGAMLVATLLGLASLDGSFGPVACAYAPFIALGASMIAVPLLAAATRGRFYLARRERRAWRAVAPACVVCGNGYAPNDTAYCPAYRGAICSLCCTLDLRCQDACRPHARAGAGIEAVIAAVVRRLSGGRRVTGVPSGRAILRFGGRFALGTAFLAALLATIALAASDPADRVRDIRLHRALEHVFLVLMLVAAVVVWWLTLAEESRTAALEENDRQTRILEDEIGRRVRADAQATRAREAAESANVAKSRFIVGVAHELRSPLNAVLGYAQILELDEEIGQARRARVRAIRIGAEHLARLIEGLLDISKIEAGRIEIERNRVVLGPFLASIADMFRLQAERSGIDFRFELAGHLPAVIATDETRLRQILINLLSNALKFTAAGAIGLRVTRAGEVTEFAVHDTGCGIPEADRERIFDPFERAGASGTVPGIGLGLTITRLLVAILGGEITVERAPAGGSVFRVRLLLSEVAGPTTPAGPPSPPIRAFRGPPRTLLAADDDATQRALLADALSPLGFALHAVADGDSLLDLVREARRQDRRVDAVLLDISMPAARDAPDGWAIARRLREEGFTAPIVVLSAHPEETRSPDSVHDAFLAKPMNLAQLRDTLGRLLELDWVLDDGRAISVATAATPAAISPGLRESRTRLQALARIGDVRALQAAIEALRDAHPADDAIGALHEAAGRFRLDEVERVLAGGEPD